jgi:cell wall-associated NlpC family hydrolase
MRGAACSLLAALALGLAGCAAHRPQEPPRPPLDTSTSGAIPSTGTPAETGGSTVFVAVALSMVGEPYRWGGAEPGGFDCSGLVVYAGRRAGLELPRTAQEQAHSGVAVPRAQVQAGDLVFMHLARKELHVGIAVDAEHFVHAPSSGGRVRVDSLAARPYVDALLQARRLNFPD